MRVLVACEFSGIVRDAFRKRGHDAMSCDLLPTETDGPHYQGDVLDILGDNWDLMVAFPPCTYLCGSGLHWNTRRPDRAVLTEHAIEFVRTLMDAPIERIAIENPVGCLSSRIRKPDQIIQPWMFGHDASKTTCLWLKNLSRLQHGIVVPPLGHVVCDKDNLVNDGRHVVRRNGYNFVTTFGSLRPTWSNQTPSGQNKLGPSTDRWALRSITYQGIANAMASQWG